MSEIPPGVPAGVVERQEWCLRSMQTARAPRPRIRWIGRLWSRLTRPADLASGAVVVVRASEAGR